MWTFIVATILMPWFFWPVLVVLGLIAAGITDESDENGSWAAALFIVMAYLISLQYGGIMNSIAWIWHNLIEFMVWAGGYLILGVAWSFGKWYFYTGNVADKVDEYICNFIDIWKKTIPSLDVIEKHLKKGREKITEEEAAEARKEIAATLAAGQIPECLKHLMFNEMDQSYGPFFKYRYRNGMTGKENGIEAYVPLAKNNKSRITTWGIYWPMSFVYTFFNDPVRRIANLVFKSLQGWYESISQRQFNKVRNRV